MPANRAYNVLFLCAGNSARSIFGEVLLNQLGEGRFKAYSAGSTPKGHVYPLTMELLETEGLGTDGLRSKSWDEFAVPGAPAMDFVFTVCDNAAGEPCPIWPGQPVTAHSGIDDPAVVTGTRIEQQAAFVKALRYMRNRIVAFTSLPISTIDRMTLQNQVRAIGAMSGASLRKPDVA